jgi:hypothetical protein
VAPSPPRELPAGLLALEFAGSLLVGLGVGGAYGAFDGLVPLFAEDRGYAWACAVLGIALGLAALPGIVRWAREQAGRR